MEVTRRWGAWVTSLCFIVVLFGWCQVRAGAAAPAVVERDADAWTLELTPYVFLPKISMGLKAGGVSAGSTMSMGDVLDNLEGAILLRMEGMKGRWGFYIEPEYLDLSMQIDGPDSYRTVDLTAAARRAAVGKLPPGVTPEQAWASMTEEQKAAMRSLKRRLSHVRLPHVKKVDVDLTAWLVDAGMIYRAVDLPLSCPLARHLQLDLTAGIRYVYMKSVVDIDIEPGALGLFPSRIKSTSRKDWVDPVLGARTRLALSDRWLLSVRGDIGGFGVGSASDFSWQVVAGMGYRLTDRTTLSAGYRKLDIDYKSGDAELDMTLEGPFAACTIRF